LEPAEARRRDSPLALTVVLAAFLGTLALNWPALPFNVRIADLIFPAVILTLVVAHRRSIPKLHWLDGLVIAYVAGSLPSFFASSGSASVVEMTRIVYLALVYAVVATVVAFGYLRITILSLVAGAFVLAAIGLGFALLRAVVPFDIQALSESMTIPYAGQVVRLRALTASPAMLACALTVAVPFAIAAFVSDANSGGTRRLFVAALVIGCAAALLTFSHAVVGLMAAMLIVLWPRLHSRQLLRAVAVALVIVVAMLANVTLVAAVRSITLNGAPVAERGGFHHAVEGRSVQLGDLRVDYEVMSYFRIKQLAVDAFVSRPWTGIGLDRFHEVTSAAHQQGRLPATYREIDPHSTLLGRLAETGILGGITLVALWIGFLLTASVLSQAHGERGWIARAALAALAGLLITSINVDVMNFRFLWATLGVVRGLRAV
jgi:O-antigen ligase